MIELKDPVYTALVTAGYMDADFTPEQLPDEWASTMLDEGVTSVQVAKTIKVGPTMAYTQARNSKLINSTHPKHPNICYTFATRQYCSFTLVLVVPSFKVLWTHKLDPSEEQLRSTTQIQICWNALRCNPDNLLLNVFNESEVNLIRTGNTKTWTWHHSIQTGVLELVSYLEHRQCGHTGGDALWTHKDHWKYTSITKSRPSSK